MDDIRRATDLAHKAVSEYGLNSAVGPLSVNALAAGGDEYAAVLRDSGSAVARCAAGQVALAASTATVHGGCLGSSAQANPLHALPQAGWSDQS